MRTLGMDNHRENIVNRMSHLYLMDMKSLPKQASEDVTRESLIAISYSAPDKVPCPKLPPFNINGEDHADCDEADKYMDELISISYSQSPVQISLPVSLNEANGMANCGLRETQKFIRGSHIGPENDENLNKITSAEDLAYNISATSSSSNSDPPQINGVLLEIADLEEALIDTIEENEALDAKLHFVEMTVKNMEDLIERLECERLTLLSENQKLNLKLDTEDELNRKSKAIIENAATEKEISLQKYDDNMKTSSCKVEELKNKVNKLQLEVDSLKIQKSELEKQMVLKESEASTTLDAQKIRLEMQLETQKQESSESLAQAEHQNIILESNIESLQRKLNEQIKSFDKLMEQHTDNEASAKIKLNHLESVIHKLKEKYKKLQILVDEYKAKFKFKEKTMEENIQKSDGKLRLLNKELQEVKKLLAAREDSYQIAEQWKCCELLGAKMGIFSLVMKSKFEDYENILLGVAKNAIAWYTADLKIFEGHISRILSEVQIAKNCVTKLNRDKTELEKLMEDQELNFKEKVGNFELRASKEEAEKEQMRKEIKALKEKIGNLELKARREEAEKEKMRKENEMENLETALKDKAGNLELKAPEEEAEKEKREALFVD